MLVKLWKLPSHNPRVSHASLPGPIYGIEHPKGAAWVPHFLPHALLLSFRCQAPFSELWVLTPPEALQETAARWVMGVDWVALRLITDRFWVCPWLKSSETQ